ncbi:virulence factor [Paenibacillus pasadenensis]|uniref:virulence factor n=1 Tax=Paenibacillus pasadenensis TaxID=217090 RepID=UPI002041BF07|nr:virulence factor [Paenibacillus pasadenensis]MCM3748731.1 virulence factor [Paenibacillus pasadenensis]
MNLISIEPTPSPNSMKLNVNETLPRGHRYTYVPAEPDSAPEPLRSLLGIPGVRSLFRTADFIALDRKPNADWAAILAEARRVLQAEESAGSAGPDASNGFGEAHVLVQMFRGIPIQVRVRMGDGETRAALPQAFTEAVSRAAGSSMIRERKLEEFGVRYGDPEDIAAEIVRELEASYTPERLDALVQASLAAGPGEQSAAPATVRPASLSAAEAEPLMAAEDWQSRYAALDRLAPDDDALPLLERALGDENASIRRLAVVYLGDFRENPQALPLLIRALSDNSASVRRTAGDTLSDLGDPAATGAMITALSDRNKLVRWRAARFLYEVGDDSALEALEKAAEDSEFEIKLQAQMALERIQRGEEAAGSVWQQMTAMRRKEAGEADAD